MGPEEDAARMARIVARVRHATQRPRTLRNCAEKFILRIDSHYAWSIAKFRLGN